MEPVSETVSTQEVWGVRIAVADCMESSRLSFSTWSIGLRRNATQGPLPAPPPTPIIDGARASLLHVGDSFFRIPPEVRAAVGWRFVPTRRTREGGRDSMGRGRSWCLIQLMGQLETPSLSASLVHEDEALHICQAPTELIQVAGQEVMSTRGCPPTWVFRSRLRVFVSPPEPRPNSWGECSGCHALRRDYLHYLASVGVLWEFRVDNAQENSVEVPNNREFPIYEHLREQCTFGHYPKIRRSFFFGPRALPVARGSLGWRVMLDANISLVLPSLFHERAWSIKIGMDIIFPLDRQLHSWLGGFVRMHGLLRVQGGRANSRETVTTEWEPLNEDMAGLHSHIHVPRWNWRVRSHFGPREDASWREVALQIAEVQSWHSGDPLGATTITISSETFGAGNYPALPLSRTEYDTLPREIFALRDMSSIASRRLADYAALRRSTQRKRICLAPSPFASQLPSQLPSEEVSLTEQLSPMTPSELLGGPAPSRFPTEASATREPSASEEALFSCLRG